MARAKMPAPQKATCAGAQLGVGCRVTRNPPPRLVSGNRVRLLHDGASCLAAMLEAIREAKSEILLEMYWFGSDNTGRRFAEALSDKARAGVRVCITYDAVGSWEADDSMFDAMREAGCSVNEFNPPRKWRLRWRVGNRRNHRKQLIVDGRLGMTGGVNLADPWAPISEGGLGFRDDLIVLEGPAVGEMRAIFFSTFEGRKAAREVRKSLPPPAAGETRVMVLANDARRNRRLIERAYLRAIRAAARRVWIENSYFIPSWLVRHAHVHAAACCRRRATCPRWRTRRVASTPRCSGAGFACTNGRRACCTRRSP